MPKFRPLQNTNVRVWGTVIFSAIEPCQIRFQAAIHVYIEIVEAICDVTWRQRAITSLLLACYKNVNSTYAYNACALDVKRLQSVSLFFCIAIVIVYSMYYVY